MNSFVTRVINIARTTNNHATRNDHTEPITTTTINAAARNLEVMTARTVQEQMKLERWLSLR